MSSLLTNKEVNLITDLDHAGFKMTISKIQLQMINVCFISTNFLVGGRIRKVDFFHPHTPTQLCRLL